MAAVNKGTCQCCGSVQKLPKGVLSLHGYRVLNGGYGGWFVGSCPGSGHLPLEVDCSMVQGFADGARQTIQTNLGRIAAARNLNAANGFGKLKKVTGKTRSNPEGFTTWEVFEYVDGQEGDTPRYRSYESKAVQAQRGTDRFVAYIERQNAQHEAYAVQLEGILRNWAPKALLPV